MVNPVSKSGFEKFLFEPWSFGNTQCSRIVMVALDALFGVLTLGTVHFGFFLYRNVTQHHVSNIPGAHKTKDAVPGKFPPFPLSTPGAPYCPQADIGLRLKQAHEEFRRWAEKAEKDGHFKPGQVKFIVENFDNACKDQDPMTSLFNKLQKRVQEGRITEGNKLRILDKAQQCLQHQGLVCPSGQGGLQSINIQAIELIAQRDGFVWFYKAPENPLTACFGNFFEVPGRIMGCKTAEGAFQLQKFIAPSPALVHELSEADGDTAFKTGQTYQARQKTKQDWIINKGNINAMRKVLEEKFKPGTELAKALLATGNAYLVEHTPKKGRDGFWADDFDGTGRNMLGILLMERRQALGGAGVVLPSHGYTGNSMALSAY
jgi:predicted NAD-dependent protein-ADP-ribosyltransferase YbiA (DUF1768 family)